MPIGTEIDRIYVSLGADLTGLRAGLKQAASELDLAVSGPLKDAAGSLDTAFDYSLSRISQGLISAAETGKASFGDMVNAILRDLQRLAFRRFVTAPLNNLFSSLFGGLFSFGGARAGGGAVAGGQAYLVGERGPELFVPDSAGRIGAKAATSGDRPFVINFNFPPGTDVSGFQRSEGQIAAMVVRATARGRRNL